MRNALNCHPQNFFDCFIGQFFGLAATGTIDKPLDAMLFKPLPPPIDCAQSCSQFDNQFLGSFTGSREEDNLCPGCKILSCFR